MYDETKEKTFRSTVGRFTELEDMLYIRIDIMRRANLFVPPSLATAKAKKYCIEFISSRNKLQGILAMAKSIQSAPRVAKDFASQRGS